MPELLTFLLDRLELEDPAFAGDDVASWPAGELNALVSAGLVREGERATSIECDACGEGHVEEARWIELPNKRGNRAYIPCPDNGSVWIAPERLRRWRVDGAALGRLVAAELGLSGDAEVLVRERLWCLGRAVVGGRSREFFLARGAGRTDFAQVVRDCGRLDGSPAAVLLVPRVVPPASVWGAAAPPVVVLASLLAWEDGGLVIDTAFLDCALPAAAGTQPPDEAIAVAFTHEDRLGKPVTPAETEALIGRADLFHLFVNGRSPDRHVLRRHEGAEPAEDGLSPAEFRMLVGYLRAASCGEEGALPHEMVQANSAQAAAKTFRRMRAAVDDCLGGQRFRLFQQRRRLEKTAEFVFQPVAGTRYCVIVPLGEMDAPTRRTSRRVGGQ